MMLAIPEKYNIAFFHSFKNDDDHQQITCGWELELFARLPEFPFCERYEAIKYNSFFIFTLLVAVHLMMNQ